MLRTPLCDLLNIEVPVIQAGMSRFTSAELAAAVSNAGGLGSLGALLRSPEDLRDQMLVIRELTSRPFAVNHSVASLSEEAFAFTLEARPPIISFAAAEPGDLVKRAHDLGSLVMHQVHNVQQAVQAAERGVDVIIAQGSEAGGLGGKVAALALIPQVVDAVRPIPVVAAGGIADGRGLAAALVLGAQGVNLGTRFLASEEAPISQAWKQAILEADSEDVVEVEVWSAISPPLAGNYEGILRAIRTPFIEEWQQRREEAVKEAGRLRGEVMEAISQDRFGELLPLAGHTSGLIHEILPAGEILRRLVAEAQEALEGSAKLLI